MKGHFQTAIKNDIGNVWSSGKDCFKSYGYKNKHELLQDAKEDLLSSKGVLDFIK